MAAAAHQPPSFRCPCPIGTFHVDLGPSFDLSTAHDINTLWHVIQEANSSLLLPLRIINFAPMNALHDFGPPIGIENIVIGYRCELDNSRSYSAEQIQNIVQRADAADKPFYENTTISLGKESAEGNYFVLFRKNVFLNLFQKMQALNTAYHEWIMRDPASST